MAKATGIPEKSRRIVRERAHDRCERCSGHGSQWHHRRSRHIRNDHTHHPCNGVWLCDTCHRWVHANPRRAQERGFIVSRYVEEPGTVPFKALSGWYLPDCEGRLITTVITERSTT